MINLNELDTTSLITIIQEMSYTDKMLNNLDNMILQELDTETREKYIIELSNQLDYYISLQEELGNRGWVLKGEEYGLKRRN